MFFVFMILAVIYYFIIAGIVALIKKRRYHDTRMVVLGCVTASILNIFVKSFICILFINIFISPLLPFELTVPYWNMVLARVAFWFLTLKIDVKE